MRAHRLGCIYCRQKETVLRAQALQLAALRAMVGLLAAKVERLEAERDLAERATVLESEVIGREAA